MMIDNPKSKRHTRLHMKQKRGVVLQHINAGASSRVNMCFWHFLIAAVHTSRRKKSKMHEPDGVRTHGSHIEEAQETEGISA